MTRMPRPRLFCISLENGQWHQCILVNDTNASDWVYITLSGQWHKCILVNDTSDERQAFLHLLIERSMTPMHFGQWHKCIWLSVNHTQWSMTRMHLVNDTNAETQAFLYLLRGWSMTPMHFGQWHECILTECRSHSVVNDTNAYGQWHECREAGFFVSP